MNEIIMNWPWFDRIAATAAIGTLIFAPWLIARHLERIQRQNDQIISLLLDIKIGRKEL